MPGTHEWFTARLVALKWEKRKVAGWPMMTGGDFLYIIGFFVSSAVYLDDDAGCRKKMEQLVSLMI